MERSGKKTFDFLLYHYRDPDSSICLCRVYALGSLKLNTQLF